MKKFGVVQSVKGSYGFIKRSPSEPDLFFHFSECADREKGFPVGARVEFIIGIGRGGREVAKDVIALPEEASC